MQNADDSPESGGRDSDIADAIQGHRQFRQAFEQDRAFYQSLAGRTQRPRLLWIGCSDSRVIPAHIVNADPGELFEVRNIAATVPPAHAPDDSVGSAVSYALEHLGIDDIVVCGHTGCGGIAARLEAGPQTAEKAQDHLDRWLLYTAPAHNLAMAAGRTGPERFEAVVKAHILFQLDNLMTYPLVRAGVASGRVCLHGWLYDMEAGEIFAYDPGRARWRSLLAPETV